MKMNTGEAERINVLPFNDIFISCFDNPIYTAVQTFGKPVRPLLANRIIYYAKCKDPKQGLVLSVGEGESSIFTVIRNMGLGIRSIRKSRDIIVDLKKSSNQRRLTLIPVDCFAIPNIPNVRENWDYYQQEHHPHFFLVVGFSEADHSFQVINSIGINTCARQYDFEITKQGYESYLRHLWDKWSPTFRVFEDRGKNAPDPEDKGESDYCRLLFQNIRKKRRKMEAGLNQLEKVRRDFGEGIKTEGKFQRLYRQYYPIIPQKTVDHSIFQSFQHQMILNPGNDLSVLRGKIAENWEFVRALMVRYKCTGEYKYSHLSKADDKLREICELEWEYFWKTGKEQ